MREFAEAGDYVVVANDIHFEGDEFHPEARLFPPHNIAGTEGRELYGAVRTAYDDVKALGASILEFDKTRYSAFAGTELDLRLRERGIREIHLVGVCTDICVLHTAVDGYNLGTAWSCTGKPLLALIRRGTNGRLSISNILWGLM